MPLQVTPTHTPPPVGLQVLEPCFQVVQEVDLLAALGAVDVHQLVVVHVPRLARGLPGAAERKRGGGRERRSHRLPGCALPAPLPPHPRKTYRGYSETKRLTMEQKA